MFAAFVDALTRPADFFERRDPSLRSGLAVVVVTATLRVATALPLLYTFRFVIPRDELLVGLAATVGFMYGYALLRWVVLGAVVYGASRPVGGSGRFRDLLGYLGWSHLPNVLVGVVVLTVTTAAVLTVPAPTSEAEAGRAAASLATNPVAQLSSAYGTVEARTGVSLGQLQYALGLGQLTWGAVMWVGAAKVGCRLDDRRALLAVALPVVVGAFVAGFPGADVGVSL